MKILHIVNRFTDAGNGIANVACDLACLQAVDGHEVFVMSPSGDYVDLLEKSGGKHICLEQKVSAKNILNLIFQSGKIIREIKPDIIHAHVASGIICARLSFYNKAKILTTMHNEFSKSSYVARFADIIVCVSDGVKTLMSKKGVRKEKLVTITNGVVGTLRRDKIQNIIPEKLIRPNIMFVGSVSKRKGADLLLQSFLDLTNYYPALNLYYIGNVDYKEVSDLAMESNSKDKIHFVGFKKNPIKYLLSADIFVIPSRKDPFPLALLEAKEAGLPIVGSNIDGIPEALDNGDSGLLFDVGDSKDLTLKLKRFLEDDDLKKEYVNKSKESVTNYTVRRMVDDYYKQYNKLE